MNLIAERINKTIKNNTILNDVSLNLESNRVYGFVGRNGSGKTMLFRALSGLMCVDSGIIRLDGKILHKDFSVLPNLGITLESACLYGEYTGLKNLKMLAKINKKAGLDDVKQALKDVGLDYCDKRPVRKYSMGMKQRLSIAQAIMEKPDILMLDEPTNGLDEKGVREIYNVILREKDRGAIILLTSHNREDINVLTDVVYSVNDGCVKELC